MPDDHVFLIIYQTDFPGKILRPQWYVEETSIDYLDINRCNIKSIAKDAFNSKQFTNLDLLSFLSQPSLTFEKGAFNGLNNLKRLIFVNVSIANLYYNFLEPLAKNLHVLSLSQIIGPMNLCNYVGSIELPNLHKLSCTANENFPKVITPNTLTKVPTITYIYLINCGIEAIMPHSFDHLPKTVFAINLRENRLVTLPSNLFDAFPIILMAADLYEHNPWKCTRDLIKLSVKFNCHFEFDCNDGLSGPKTSGESLMENEGGRSIWDKQKCANHYGTNTLRISFTTAFILKIIERNELDYVYVKSSQRATFYLLLMWRKNDNTDRASIESRCVFTRAKYAAIWIRNTEISTYFACTFDDNQSIKVWPMNCFSFSIKASQPRIYEKLVVVMGLCYLIVFLISLVCGGFVVERRTFLIACSVGAFTRPKIVVK